MQQPPPPPPHMSPKPGPPYMPGIVPSLSQHVGKMPQGIPGLPIPLGGAPSLSSMSRPNGLHYPPPPPGMASLPTPPGLKLNLPTPPPLVSSLPSTQPGSGVPSYPTPPSSSQSTASSPPMVDSRNSSSSHSKTKESCSNGTTSSKSSPGVSFPAASSPSSGGISKPASQGQRRARSPSDVAEGEVSPKRARSGSPSATNRQGDTSTTAANQEAEQAGSDNEDVGDADATVVNQEIHKSTNAIFIKHLSRGPNSCSRCDFHYKAPPDQVKESSRSADRRKSEGTSSSGSHSEGKSSHHQSHSSASSSHRDADRDKDRKEKSDSPQSSKMQDSGRPSSLPHASSAPSLPGMPGYGRVSPGRMPYGFGGSDLTPALHKLSEYARPHVLGDPGRGLPYPPHPSMDPYLRLAAAYPPGSRERLELELEREKRERDAREREMRERELKDLEMREKMKPDFDANKPPGFERLIPPGANPMDPYWTELLKRYAAIPGSSGSGVAPPMPIPGLGSPLNPMHPHMPGIYPPTSLSTDLLQREREKIERMSEAARAGPGNPTPGGSSAAGGPTSDPMRNANLAFYEYYQRISYEQIVLHRAQAAAAAGKDPAAAAADQARMAEYARLAQHFARADPLSSGLGFPPPSSSQGPPVGHPLLEAARQQEMMYRELLSRPPYSTDPVLQSQVVAQIMAQQEALHRHVLAERERMAGGAPGHMPR